MPDMQTVDAINMVWWEAMAWGAFGSVVIDGFRAKQMLSEPVNPDLGAATILAGLIGQMIRMGIGATLVLAVHRNGVELTSLMAMSIGISAPAIINKLGSEVPEGIMPEEGKK